GDAAGAEARGLGEAVDEALLAGAEDGELAAALEDRATGAEQQVEALHGDEPTDDDEQRGVRVGVQAELELERALAVALAIVIVGAVVGRQVRVAGGIPDVM